MLSWYEADCVFPRNDIKLSLVALRLPMHHRLRHSQWQLKMDNQVRVRNEHLTLTLTDTVLGSYYFYAPNHAAAIAFGVLFFLTGACHVWQCIHYKSWRVTGLHPWCCALFVAGFAMRAYGSYHFDNLGIYIGSALCLYCAP